MSNTTRRKKLEDEPTEVNTNFLGSHISSMMTECVNGKKFVITRNKRREVVIMSLFAYEQLLANQEK